MEWYRQTLSLTWVQKISALKQAALGLEYVHAQGVIHRGVNSHSFLVFDKTENSVRIADFSSAIEITDVRTISVRRHIGPFSLDSTRDLRGEIPTVLPPTSSVLESSCTRSRRSGTHMALDPQRLIFGEKKKNGVPPCDVPADCPSGLAELMQACCSSDATQRPCMRAVREFLCRLDGTS